jgi:hypothetical protein
MEPRRFLGVAGIGIAWAIAWGAIFAVLMAIIGGEPAEGVDPREGPLAAIRLAMTLGFGSGTLFGVLLAWMENRKLPRDLSMVRAVFLGALGSAIPPLATPIPDDVLASAIPVGMACAAAFVGLARGASRGDGLPPPLGWIGRMHARLLAAVCGASEQAPLGAVRA